MLISKLVLLRGGGGGSCHRPGALPGTGTDSDDMQGALGGLNAALGLFLDGDVQGSFARCPPYLTLHRREWRRSLEPFRGPLMASCQPGMGLDH